MYIVYVCMYVCKPEIKKEVNNYLYLEVQSSDNPLQWLLDHRRHFPILSHIARKYLCILQNPFPQRGPLV